MWSFQRSVVIGTSISLFLAPNIVLVSIFVENRTFLNFDGVGHGCGRSKGQRPSGPVISFSSHQILSWYRFWLETEHFLILCGVGHGCGRSRGWR